MPRRQPALRPAAAEFRTRKRLLAERQKNPALRESLAEGFRLRPLLGIEEVHMDYDAVLALATQTGLTAYDGAYLWLTRHLGAELVTRDRGLAAVSAA